MSSQNRKILVQNLPIFVSEADVMVEMMKLTKGVEDVRRSLDDPTSMIVIYERHRNAALARKVLLAPDLLCWGRVIGIDWAVPSKKSTTTMLLSRYEHLKEVCTRLSWTLMTRIFRLRKPGGSGDFFLCWLRIHEAWILAKPTYLCETVEQAKTLAVLTLQTKLANWFNMQVPPQWQPNQQSGPASMSSSAGFTGLANNTEAQVSTNITNVTQGMMYRPPSNMDDLLRYLRNLEL